MNGIISSISVFLGLPGYYLIALLTFLLSAAIALYVAKSLKKDTVLQNKVCGVGKLQSGADCNLGTCVHKDEFICENENEETPSKCSQNYSHFLNKFNANRYQQKLEKILTPEQIEEELRTEREQLAAIFELLRKQEAELNLKSMAEADLKEQVKLYR